MNYEKALSYIKELEEDDYFDYDEWLPDSTTEKQKKFAELITCAHKFDIDTEGLFEYGADKGVKNTVHKLAQEDFVKFHDFLNLAMDFRQNDYFEWDEIEMLLGELTEKNKISYLQLKYKFK